MHSKVYQGTESTLEIHCFEGKLTSGDPFVDSGVGTLNPKPETLDPKP